MINSGKRKGVCPICHKKVIRPNSWVRYHVRYNPVIEIYACKFCNFAEWALRKNIPLNYNKWTASRVPFVLAYQKRFNQNL